MKRCQRILAAMLALCLLAGMVPTLAQPVQAEDTVPQTVDVTLYVGQKVTLTDDTGVYEDYESVGDSVAIALTSGVSYSLEDAVSVLDTSKRYYIQNTRAGDILTGKGHQSGGLIMTGSTTDVPDNSIWQIAYNGVKYALFQETGKNLVMASGNASLSGSEYNLYLEYQSDGYWYIRDGINGLNDFGGYQERAAGWGDLDDGSRWIFYEAVATYETTSITFSGNKPGYSEVKIGTTVYNVTVLEHPETPNAASTPVVSGTGSSTAENNNAPVTALILGQGLSLDLNIGDHVINGDTVTWAMADITVATVDENGTVTGVSGGSTTLIVTVDGAVYQIPITITPYTDTTSYATYDFYILEATNTNAYYSLDCSDTLVDIATGTYIYIRSSSVEKPSAMDFFGTPDNGYVLNLMGATNGGDYQAIDSDDPAQTLFYTKAYTAGWNQAQDSRFGSEAVLSMIESVIEKEGEGGLGYTVDSNASRSISSALRFVSERLPTLDKVVLGVLGESGLAADYREYTPGMTARIGEQVWFKITVTNYVTHGPAIEYSNAILKDTLKNGKLMRQNPDTGIWDLLDDSANYAADGSYFTKDIEAELDAAITRDTQYTYIVSYTITEEDLGTPITNLAALSYEYQSTYNSASFTLDAQAQAQIEPTQFPPKHIVVDFGLPTTVYFENWGAGRNLVSGTALYGNVEVTTVYTAGEEQINTNIEGWYITYTPTQVLQKTDVISLVADNNAVYALYAYPATTVYYEEGFASYSGFTGGARGTGTQTGSFVGSKDHYGFDATYAGQAAGPSGGSEAVSEAKGNTATFTFTGTGVEIYANCTTGTGLINVLIRNSAGQYVRFYQVDTVTGGASPITTPQAQLANAFSLPVVSVLGLTRDTYTVTITHAVRNLNQAAGQVKIDGFRVHGTLSETAAPYVSDGESAPEYIELRNELLTVVQAPDKCDSMYEAASGIVDQVFEASNSLTGVTYLSNRPVTWESGSIKDLLDNGPKNELYLYQNGDVLLFNVVPKGSFIQIGMKSVDSAAGYEITVDGSVAASGTVTSSTDMFYRIPVTRGVNNAIVIKNTGSSILSVTKLKSTLDASANAGETQTTALAELTADGIVFALSAMGVQEEAEPESPFTDVQEGKYYYDAVLWAVENGITQGTSGTTFEPDKICTRGQIVTFLWRMAGSPEPASLESSFTDVNVNNRFIKSIMWAVERGITKGTGDGTTFEPDKECTRGQIVMFLWRYYGCPEPESLENPFTDVSEHNTFFKPILWAYYEDITKGKTQTTFVSGDPCTRGQAVTFLYRSRAEE